MNFETKPLSAGLYFVATPIGSARDMTLRGLDILASADVIAAEDTRTARKLMEIHGVPLAQRQLVAFHDHSGPAVIAKLLESIKQGRSVAYVSEAGTPLVANGPFRLCRVPARIQSATRNRNRFLARHAFHACLLRIAKTRW